MFPRKKGTFACSPGTKTRNEGTFAKTTLNYETVLTHFLSRLLQEATARSGIFPDKWLKLTRMELRPDPKDPVNPCHLNKRDKREERGGIPEKDAETRVEEGAPS